MEETNGGPQRCCLLGVCCPPGSPAQRQALKEWLIAKIAGAVTADTRFSIESQGAPCLLADVVDSWLDELPWEKEPTDAQGG